MIILPDDHVVKKFGEIFVDNTICNTGCLCFFGIHVLTIGVEFGKIRGKALEILASIITYSFEICILNAR